MTFFEELHIFIPAGVAKTLLNFNVKLDFSSSQKDKKFRIIKQDNLVIFFVKNLSPKEQKILKRTIKKHFNGDELYLIEETKIPLLDRLYKYNNAKDNQILAFFKPHLSDLDWQALRDSLFLRNEFNNHNNISIYKSDIIMRYGERGNTISNLCTAGYFEEVMIPLFNKSIREFWEYYDLAIDRGITALFVNAGMTIEKIQHEIKRRLISAKSYGLPFIHIHGIGKKNIENIKKCISKEKETGNFTEKNVLVDEKLGVLVVEILL